jgi:arsenite methyltransferase
MKGKEIKKAVKGRYSRIAKQDQKSCCPSCSRGASSLLPAEAIGYLKEDLQHIPEEAIMGLGCGNPTAITELEAGEVVLDLGAGAGVDVFLAASKVGPTGRVIGVDMTEEMVDKARKIARDHGYRNVEFRLGEMESLPVEDKSVDAVLSNCVINLSPDKSRAFREAYRVLKPGGRLTVSDIVSEGALPNKIRSDLNAWASCIGGALEQREYLNKIEDAGFKNVQVVSSNEFCMEGEEGQVLAKLLSISVKAYK